MKRAEPICTTDRVNLAGGRALRALMKRLGYRWRDVARLSRCSWDTIRVGINQRWKNRRLQARIEAGLGVPIWSTSAEWARRKERFALLGRDPAFIPCQELKALARRLAVPNYWWATREELISEICARLAVNPTLRQSATHRSK